MKQYEDPILAKIRDLLNAHGPKELQNKYYLGDPMLVNKSSLPMAFISFERHDIIDDASHSIETHSTVIIDVAYDLTQDFNRTSKTSGSHMALAKMICGRNDQYQLLDDSILAVLRRFQDDQEDQLIIELGTSTQVEYIVNERGNSVFTNEAVVRFMVRTREFVG